MTSPPTTDLAFRDALDRVGAWIDDYYREGRRYPVLSRSRPGDLVRALPAQAPQHGESFEQIFADFERLVVPGIITGTTPAFSPTSRLAPLL